MADVELALVVFLTFPLLAIASLVFRIVAASAYRITRERIAEVTAYLQESLSGVRVVRSFAQEERHVERMARAQRAQPRGEPEDRLPERVVLPGGRAALGDRDGGDPALRRLPGARPGDGVDARNAQIGVVVAFVGYLSTFFDPIQQLSNLYTTYQQGMAALDKIFDLLDTEPDMVDKPDALDPRTLRGEIEMDGVWFSYGLDKDGRAEAVERERSRRTATRSEDDAATGRSRTSRSTCPPARRWRWSARPAPGSRTFAKLVSRFYDPQRGRVLVDGHDLRDLSSTCLRSQLGIVPQEGFLFSGTVRENIAFGRPGRVATRRSRRPPTRSAPATSSGGCRMASTPRSASAAWRSRPGSGS